MKLERNLISIIPQESNQLYSPNYLNVKKNKKNKFKKSLSDILIMPNTYNDTNINSNIYNNIDNYHLNNKKFKNNKTGSNIKPIKSKINLPPIISNINNNINKNKINNSKNKNAHILLLNNALDAKSIDMPRNSLNVFNNIQPLDNRKFKNRKKIKKNKSHLNIYNINLNNNISNNQKAQNNIYMNLAFQNNHNFDNIYGGNYYKNNDSIYMLNRNININSPFPNSIYFNNDKIRNMYLNKNYLNLLKPINLKKSKIKSLIKKKSFHNVFFKWKKNFSFEDYIINDYASYLELLIKNDIRALCKFLTKNERAKNIGPGNKISNNKSSILIHNFPSLEKIISNIEQNRMDINNNSNMLSNSFEIQNFNKNLFIDFYKNKGIPKKSKRTININKKNEILKKGEILENISDNRTYNVDDSNNFINSKRNNLFNNVPQMKKNLKSLENDSTGGNDEKIKNINDNKALQPNNNSFSNNKNIKKTGINLIKSFERINTNDYDKYNNKKKYNNKEANKDIFNDDINNVNNNTDSNFKIINKKFRRIKTQIFEDNNFNLNIDNNIDKDIDINTSCNTTNNDFNIYNNRKMERKDTENYMKSNLKKKAKSKFFVNNKDKEGLNDISLNEGKKVGINGYNSKKIEISRNRLSDIFNAYKKNSKPRKSVDYIYIKDVKTTNKILGVRFNKKLNSWCNKYNIIINRNLRTKRYRKSIISSKGKKKNKIQKNKKKSLSEEKEKSDNDNDNDKISEDENENIISNKDLDNIIIEKEKPKIQVKSSKKLYQFNKELDFLNKIPTKTKEEIEKEEEIHKKHESQAIKFLIQNQKNNLTIKKEKRPKIKFSFFIDKDKLKRIRSNKKENEKEKDIENKSKAGRLTPKRRSLQIFNSETYLSKILKNQLVFDNSYLYRIEKKKKRYKEFDNILSLIPDEEKDNIIIHPNKDKNNKKNKNRKENKSRKESRKNLNKGKIVEEDSNKEEDSFSSSKSEKLSRFKRRKKFKIVVRKNIISKLMDNDIESDKELLKEEDESEIRERKLMEKLYNFFEKIQKLKNSDNKSEVDDFITEELERNGFNERRQRILRLNNFIEDINYYREIDKLLKPKMKYLSPICFSYPSISKKK